MTTLEKIYQLEQQLISNNFQLLNQVRTLNPEDQKVYSEKVSRLIERTHETVSNINKKVLRQQHPY